MGKTKSIIIRAINYIRDDYRRQTLVLTLPSIPFDILYALFSALTAIVCHSAWLGTMSAYYLLLSYLRINVLYRTGRGRLSNNEKFSEINNYKHFSRTLILVDFVLAGAVYLIIFNKVLHDYPQYLIYLVSFYVFYKVILAGINLGKANKSQPLTTISLRKIGIVDALVSLLILQWALIRQFGNPLSDFARLMNSTIGVLVWFVILIMSLTGLIHCRRLEYIKRKEE